jgi:hypothetical protein
MISCQSKNGQAWEGSSLDIFQVSTPYQLKKIGYFTVYAFHFGILLLSIHSWHCHMKLTLRYWNFLVGKTDNFKSSMCKTCKEFLA